MADKKKTYTPMPTVPEVMAERYRVTLQVMAGAMTVSEAARTLGISRNHYQTLMHRGLVGLVEGLSPKLPGRPSKPPSEQRLAEQNEQLRRQNEDLLGKVEMMERVLGVASELIKGRPSPRPPRPRRAKGKKGPGESDEDGRRGQLDRCRQMRRMGLTVCLAAALVGSSPATVRRWSTRDRCGQPLRRRQGWSQSAPPDAQSAALVEDLVRQTHGLLGAASLGRSVAGVSRRGCAAIKGETITALEHERRAAAVHVVVTVPGVVRGFDQFWLRALDGLWPLLVSADASVPFRTSLMVAEHYDGPSVLLALERDIARWGAPLVYRLDRARSHDVPEVRNMLKANGVLVLHGPPHCPRFYGQLERQNREHRAWFRPLGRLHPSTLQTTGQRMIDALNALWKRRTLGWRTASEVWQERPRVMVDRNELREEVNERAARIGRQLNVRGAPADLAERLAIEAALTQRGFLRREAGGWC